jgi:Uma2 family endonuclease
MAAKGTAYETCITRLLRVLPQLVGDRATLRCQSPITLAFDGEPEPDFSIVRNREDDYTTAHPTPEDVLLVIEVADSSLDYDRQVKLPLYAEANIKDYWLFNLPERYLETYREPCRLTPTQFGYLSKQIVPAGGAIALPFSPEQVLSLDRLFP